jgi:hypothetical protein
MENVMVIVRIALHLACIGLFVLLIVQTIQLVLALQTVQGPDAFSVSSLLLAALAFKGPLILINLLLLWLTHKGIRRLSKPKSIVSSDNSLHIAGEPQ